MNEYLTYKNIILYFSYNFGVIYAIFIEIYTNVFKPNKIKYVTDVIPVILQHSSS